MILVFTILALFVVYLLVGVGVMVCVKALEGLFMLIPTLLARAVIALVRLVR